jgi:hypothetical protein
MGEIKRETMALETAVELYDVKLSTLRLMCLRKTVKATKVGKYWYVTPAAMDKVFKGLVVPEPKAKRQAK